MKFFRLFILFIFLVMIGFGAWPCSRVVYRSDSGLVMVGRTLDWHVPIPTNLYVYPAGVEKSSMPSGNCFHWTSRYGSVLAVGYDGGVTEGMNECGLVMNGLFCKTTVYPFQDPGATKPVMSMAMFVSYFLDNFSTVDQVVAWLRNNPFVFAGQTFDGGKASLLHWGVTDRSGNTAVIEFDGGELNIYTGTDIRVLTNDPRYTDMQAIEGYWKGVGGVNFLPGTVRSADRFARAAFFISHVPSDLAGMQAWGALNSIMGAVSVPYGYTVEGEPNVSMTQWRSIADASNLKYYMRFADSTGDFWIDLSQLLLYPGAPVLKLDTSGHTDLTGCVNNRLATTPGFTPMW